jgi:hypothetical protein
MKKGLTVWVYRSHLGDCTNNGESSKVNMFTLIGEGIAEIFEPSEDAPAMYLETKEYSFGKVTRAIPESKRNKWTMFGGNFIYSSDSRFSEISGGAPIKIFDRVEG